MADDTGQPAYDLTPTRQDLESGELSWNEPELPTRQAANTTDNSTRQPYDITPVQPNSETEYSMEIFDILHDRNGNKFTPRVLKPSVHETTVMMPPTAEEFMARVTAASDSNRERMKIEEEQFTHYTDAMRDPLGGYMRDGEAERDWLLLKYVPALGSERTTEGNTDWVLPDAVSLRAYSRKLIGQDWFEARGFTLYDLYEGLRRLRLNVPGHEVEDEDSWAAGILRKASRIE